MNNYSEIIIIAAHAKNLVIGNQGLIPWHLPQDLKRFKSLTTNNPIIMGRKTFNSIGILPNRDSIVISNTLTEGTYYKDCEFCSVTYSLEKALEIASYSNKVYIIGGATIYTQALSIANTMELTVLPNDYTGDTLFPKYAHLIDTEFYLDREQDCVTHINKTYRRIK